MTRLTLAACAVVLATLHGYGQQLPAEKMKRAMDSIKAAYIDIAALKMPIIRQAGVTLETFGSGSIRSRLNGNPLFKGKTQTTRVSAWFNVPVAHIGKTLISANFGARHQIIDLYDVENFDPTVPVANGDIKKTMLSTSVNATRLDSLFGKMAAYSLSASIVADPDTWQYRLVFSGLFSLTIKQTPTTSLSIGALVLTDPTAPIPVIPYIRYSHRFKGSELFIDPSRIALRKELNARNFLWISNDIGGNMAMFKFKNDRVPSKSIYTTLELKSGLTYEYRLTKKTIVTLGGGIVSTLNSRFLEQNKSREPFIKNKQAIVPYAQIGISCLPFWKGLTHK